MNKVDTSTPVVVFRSERYTSLGIVRSLGRMGVRVFCVDHERDALAMKSRYCAGQYFWDTDSSPAIETIKFLKNVSEHIGSKPILFPTFDTRNLLVDQYRDVLSQYFLLPYPKPGAVQQLYSKRAMYDLCKRENISTAETAFPDSIEQALDDCTKFGFPLAIKAIDADRLMHRKGRRMAIVRDQSELRDAYTELDEPGISNLALQEYIPGEINDSWVVSAYFDNSSNCKFAITGQKLRQLPIQGGVTTFGVCVPCESIVNSITHVAKAAGYHGIIDADFLYSKRDGDWKLLDINPRPGANFRLFVDKHGHDVVRAQYLDLTGQKQPVVEPSWGRRWLVEDKDLEAMQDYRSNGSLTIFDWLKSLHGLSELAYIDLGDLKPSILFIMKEAKYYLNRIFKRIQRSFKSR